MKLFHLLFLYPELNYLEIINSVKRKIFNIKLVSKVENTFLMNSLKMFIPKLSEILNWK